MLFNPIRTLSIRLCRVLFNQLRIPTNIFTFSLTLFTIIIPLISSVGFIPVFRVLNGLRRIIRDNLPLNLLNVIYGDIINPFVVTILTNTLDPIIRDCYKVKNFSKIYNWLIFPLLSLSMFRPFIKWLFKFTFGLLLSSIGILWNETLSSISVLFKRYF